MNLRCLLALLGVGLAAVGCHSGGGGGAAPPPVNAPPPPPPVDQSPGGIWHGFAATGESFTLLVAESGELRVLETKNPAGSNPLTFGSGALLVTGGTVSGAYDARSVSAVATPTPLPEQDCDVAGSLTERVSMQVTIECTDTAGGARTVQTSLTNDAAHGAGSSLAVLEGNYVLTFRPASNVLSINANGVLFGQYDNGANCTVNGTAEALDPRFNLYRFELHLSLCQPPLLFFEGVAFTGFGHTAPPGPPGAFFMLLSGVVNGELMFISLLYERS